MRYYFFLPILAIDKYSRACFRWRLTLFDITSYCGHKIFSSNHALSIHTKATGTAQKLKFSIKDFSSKCDQIRRKLIQDIFSGVFMISLTIVLVKKIFLVMTHIAVRIQIINK